MTKIFEQKMQDLINFIKHLNIEISDRKERLEELSKNLKANMKEVKENFLKASENIFQN